METEWLVWLIFACILAFVIAINVIESSPSAKKTEEPKEEENHWTPKSGEVAAGQKWFTKY